MHFVSVYFWPLGSARGGNPELLRGLLRAPPRRLVSGKGGGEGGGGEGGRQGERKGGEGGGGGEGEKEGVKERK